jgi:hypothetical protein
MGISVDTDYSNVLDSDRDQAKEPFGLELETREVKRIVPFSVDGHSLTYVITRDGRVLGKQLDESSKLGDLELTIYGPSTSECTARMVMSERISLPILVNDDSKFFKHNALHEQLEKLCKIIDGLKGNSLEVKRQVSSLIIGNSIVHEGEYKYGFVEISGSKNVHFIFVDSNGELSSQCGFEIKYIDGQFVFYPTRDTFVEELSPYANASKKLNCSHFNRCVRSKVDDSWWWYVASGVKNGVFVFDNPWFENEVLCKVGLRNDIMVHVGNIPLFDFYDIDDAVLLAEINESDESPYWTVAVVRNTAMRRSAEEAIKKNPKFFVDLLKNEGYSVLKGKV